MNNRLHAIVFLLLAVSSAFLFTDCRRKKELEKTPVVTDTTASRCRLDFKSAKTLIRNIKESEFQYEWLFGKAEVASNVDGKDENFDIRLTMRKDSAILVSIRYILGLEVAKVLITKDSVKLVNYINKTFFRGDMNYINEILNADLDYDVVQAVLFGNSAEFYDDDAKLKPVTDRHNCHYLLGTERRRRLKKIAQGQAEPRKSLQMMTLNPDNFKIIKNEFVDVETSRTFTVAYDQFITKDSVYAPRHVNIDIVAEKKVNLKIDYVRIEKTQPQKLSVNIPAKYDPIPVKKQQQ